MTEVKRDRLVTKLIAIAIFCGMVAMVTLVAAIAWPQVLVLTTILTVIMVATMATALILHDGE